MNMRRIVCFGLLILMLASASLYAKKIGIALSGGGARGFAQIGILKVLEENGIHPDYISGTSIGAVVGALYALGYTSSEIEALALSINWQEIFDDKYQRKDLYIGQKRWTPYGNTSLELNDRWQPQLPQSVFSANDVNLELFRLFAASCVYTDFADFPIPFSCIATNLLSGEELVFGTGSLMQAVKASMSIPSIMKPLELNDSLFIDGGITQNLPVSQVRAMGADLVIAMKTNTGLRPHEKINNLFQVYDQSINIGITRNVNVSLEDADFIFAPELEGYNASNFRSIKQIIDAGEAYARSMLVDLLAFVEEHDIQLHTHNKLLKPNALHTICIKEIAVVGNQDISSTKIKEYLDISENRHYSLSTLVRKSRVAWNLQLFHYIYPVLEPVENGFRLIIHVKERERKNLAPNIYYSSEDNLVAGIVLSLQNYLARNSQLLTEIKIGGKNELNIDYVRNFGDYWGIYYRLFPYVNEKTLFLYENHNKIMSMGSLETGFTAGLGMFAGRLAVLESYGFHYHT
ncbi:MAG: patatin-like phospholipase family protein, partial [Candidatus Cloacimonadaceae bacterium]|nr:patatin-like phospholipase family protein [Candidatus Cloacimonadaceae bacterium]